MADTNNEATSPAPAALIIHGIPVGVPVPVDAELDPDSDNPVSNKAVSEKFAWIKSNDGTVPETAIECRVRGSITLDGMTQCMTQYLTSSDLATNGRFITGAHDGQVPFLMITTITNRVVRVGYFLYAGTVYTPTVSVEYR